MNLQDLELDPQVHLRGKKPADRLDGLGRVGPQDARKGLHRGQEAVSLILGPDHVPSLTVSGRGTGDEQVKRS